jgi:hypothetical protein
MGYRTDVAARGRLPPVKLKRRPVGIRPPRNVFAITVLYMAPYLLQISVRFARNLFCDGAQSLSQ